MKKLRWSLSFLLTILVCCGAAAALENDTVKVGLRYGSSAMFSANLENAVGSGYAFGYYDGSRSFLLRLPFLKRQGSAKLKPCGSSGLHKRLRRRSSGNASSATMPSMNSVAHAPPKIRCPSPVSQASDT